jgi:hypothetical protein
MVCRVITSFLSTDLSCCSHLLPLLAPRYLAASHFTTPPATHGPGLVKVASFLSMAALISYPSSLPSTPRLPTSLCLPAHTGLDSSRSLCSCSWIFRAALISYPSSPPSTLRLPTSPRLPAHTGLDSSRSLRSCPWIFHAALISYPSSPPGTSRLPTSPCLPARTGLDLSGLLRLKRAPLRLQSSLMASEPSQRKTTIVPALLLQPFPLRPLTVNLCVR